MNITIIGTGYIGLITGVGLAELGHEVYCLDINQSKINQLKAGACPIFEPGLTELLKKNKTHIHFTSSYQEAFKKTEIVFIAVGTPTKKDGEVDLKAIKLAAEEIGNHAKPGIIVINKSTVPIGTNQLIRKIIQKKSVDKKIDVIFNPEFLREGSGIYDFSHPDRIIIGKDKNTSPKTIQIVKKLYQSFSCPILITDLASAEMIKYASNAHLAMQISFSNGLADLAEKVDADINDVMKGVKLDHRIGLESFLNPGIGFGGSCLPKDLNALINIAEKQGVPFNLLKEVRQINETRIIHFLNKLKKVIPNLTDKKIALLGLSFKPNTDDLRDAPSLKIINELLKLKAKVFVYDPIALSKIKELKLKINLCSDIFKAIKGAEAILILTEWPEIAKINFKKVKKELKKPLIIDGRNIFNPDELKKLGYTYISIGRKKV